VIALKKLKGIGKATLHGEPSEQAVFNTISYIVRTLGAKDGLDLVVVRKNSNEKKDETPLNKTCVI
jgi:hypothetical protein